MGLSNDLSCEAGSLSCCRPNPHRCFHSDRGLRLYFAAVEPWVTWSASLPAVPPVYLWANVGPWCATRHSACPVLHHSESGPLGLFCANVGPQVVRLPALLVPHSSSLSPATATGVLSTPVPVSAPPPSLHVCLFLSTWCQTSLPFDFLSVLVVRGGAVCLPTLPPWFVIRNISTK